MPGSANTPSDKDPPATAESLAHAQTFSTPKAPSVGEQWWNRLTYTGVGYAANLAVSVVLWDFFINSKGKPVYTGIQKAAESAFKIGGMKAETAKFGGEGFAKYIFSPLGGHFTMVPVKIMEDHAGTLEMHDNPGGGARVVLCIPLEQAGSTESAPPRQSTQSRYGA